MKKNKLIHFFALGFGSGLCPIMPGTCGTIVAIPIYLLLAKFSIFYYSLILIIMILIGFWICDVTAKDLGTDDPPSVVWDEIVGFLLTMIAVPVNWLWIILGFGLFRIFDIIKPWPIKTLETKLPGGIGIVVDDLAAGIFAAIILRIIIYLWITL